MIDWNDIETVLLDMDGTLLDLYFDDYFWQVELPKQWGEQNGMDMATARASLLPIFQNTAATLSWYCLDYWSDRLNFDVFAIGASIEHLIRVRPHVEEFLEYLALREKHIVLVTNSHEKFIALKMESTGLDRHFHHIFNAHSFGAPKEDREFWEALDKHIDFTRESTLLIDDNLSVLRSAQRHGIRYLLSIAQPNSQVPARDTGEFTAITTFRDLCY